MKITLKVPWWLAKLFIPKKIDADLQRRSTLTGEAMLGGNYLKGALSAYIKYGNDKDEKK